MNIFVLDTDPRVAAEMLCDKHVVKMIVESCQLMSTAHHVLDGVETFRTSKNGRRFKTYERVISGCPPLLQCMMRNHPCAIWTRQSSENYSWLYMHTQELLVHYHIRYEKEHAYTELFNRTLSSFPYSLSRYGAATPFVQAMPEKYRQLDAVKAYREYYICEKAHFAKWKCGNVPNWFAEAMKYREEIWRHVAVNKLNKEIQ